MSIQHEFCIKEVYSLLPKKGGKIVKTKTIYTQKCKDLVGLVRRYQKEGWTCTTFCLAEMGLSIATLELSSGQSPIKYEQKVKRLLEACHEPI